MLQASGEDLRLLRLELLLGEHPGILQLAELLQLLEHVHDEIHPVLLPCLSRWRSIPKRKVNRPGKSYETVESSDEKSGAGTNRRRTFSPSLRGA